MFEPTREDIENYQPHYAERVPDWINGSELWPAHWGTTAAEIGNGEWKGDAAEEATVTAYRHLGVADEAAGIVAGHAAAAQMEASAMTGAQSMYNMAVENAEGEEFNAEVMGPFSVGNDHTVTDPNPPTGLLANELKEARQAMLEYHQERVSSAATTMQQLSQNIATGVDVRTRSLTETTRYPEGGGVQMVDNTECNDPGYESGIERRMGAAAILGAIGGFPFGGPAGSAEGVLIAELLELGNEVTGDGPKCQ
jgi:hypothetical protein